MKLEKWLLVPDTHVPFHDRKAFALMLRAAKAANVKNVALLGDFADFYCVSSHPKPPGRKSDLRWEVDEVSAALRQLEGVFTGKKIYCLGNHEWRLERYLTDRAPELFSSMTIEGELGLKERGWAVTPYKSDTRIGKLYLTHDLGKAGRFAHYDALAGYQGNVVIGHTHRFGLCVEGNAKGKAHVAAHLGWLGDPKQCDYMHRIRAARDWAQGFGIVYVEPSGNVHIAPIPIVDGKVLVEGKLVR